jgi:uncharacterized membrane protein YbhN (UPF0104 family)
MIEWERLIVLLSRIENNLLFIPPILLLVGLFFASIRWQHLLTALDINQKIKNLYAYYIIGNFYSIFLPGVIGGDIVRIGMCTNETKSPISIITTSALIERFCGIIMLFVIASLVIFILPLEILSCLGETFTKALPIVTALTVVIISSAFVLFRRRLLNYPGGKKQGGLLNKSVQLFNLMVTLPYPTIFTLIIFSALFQATDVLASFVIAKALNLNIPLPLFFTIMPIVYICTILPISLGGLGVRESAFVYLLAKVGILTSDAIVLSFLIYCNRIVIGFLGGLTHVFWKGSISAKQLSS